MICRVFLEKENLPKCNDFLKGRVDIELIFICSLKDVKVFVVSLICVSTLKISGLCIWLPLRKTGTAFLMCFFD